jgi:hypothetical protein
MGGQERMRISRKIPKEVYPMTDKETVDQGLQAMREAIWEMALDELPTISKSANYPLRRQHLLRVMLKLAEGAGTDDLKEAVGDVTQRTLENDLAYLRRFGVLRSKPGKKTVGKWGQRPHGRNAGRPPKKYWLVSAHDLITSDLTDVEERRKLIFLERSITAEPEFRAALERQFEAVLRFVKMTPQIVDAIRPFRKIPEFKHLLKNLPPTQEIQVNYSLLDVIIPGEWVDRFLVRTRISIPDEFFIPLEAAFRLRFL